MVPQTKNQESRIKNQEEDKATGKKEGSEDMGQTMQKQMAIMMPLMIGFFAYSFQLGLSLYWNTFTLFGIIQQYKLAQAEKIHEEKNSKN